MHRNRRSHAQVIAHAVPQGGASVAIAATAGLFTSIVIYTLSALLF